MIQEIQTERHITGTEEITQRDIFIEELESQLTDARSQLLETKLTLQDRDEQLLSVNA